MAGPKLRVIPGILEEHFEELQFLWGQRQAALRSPLYTLRELADLEERIEAHVQGLLVGGEYSIALVRADLFGDDPSLSFLAAYVLMRLNRTDTREQVMAAFLHAAGGQLQGIRQALCHLPIEPILPELRRFLAVSPIPIAAEVALAVAEVLAFHGKLEIKSQQMESFLKDGNAELRQAAWRAAALTIPQRPDTYRAALQDKDPAVRREALFAAGWGRQPWVLDHCRK